MTHEEYKKRHLDLRNRISNLQSEMSELASTRIQDSLFQVGDKVKVTQVNAGKEKETVCFIKSVKTDLFTEFKYKFAKVKKNGESSTHEEWIWDYGTIEKVPNSPQP